MGSYQKKMSSSSASSALQKPGIDDEKEEQ